MYVKSYVEACPSLAQSEFEVAVEPFSETL